jgi:hypothetical protein
MEVGVVTVQGAIDAEMAIALAERLPEARLVEIGAIFRDAGGDLHVRIAHRGGAPVVGLPDVVAACLRSSSPGRSRTAGVHPVVTAVAAALDEAEAVVIGAAEIQGAVSALFASARLDDSAVCLGLERAELDRLRSLVRQRPSVPRGASPTAR